MVHALKEGIKVTQLKLVPEQDIVSHFATLFQISPQGFYLRLSRKDLCSSLRDCLSLNKLCNKEIDMYFPLMNMHLDGTVSKTRHTGRGVFDIFVKIPEDTPSYWFECLMDMLISYPHGEFSNLEFLSAQKLDN